jgi:micrococcal nuclease
VVTRTVDGDTVYVRYRGREIDVRLIGIDTPETVDPLQPVGCYGPQASHFTERVLTGEPIRLEFDVERHDRYGRVLAYVWLRDHLFNRRLVVQGYAVVSTYPPNVRYERRFEAAQRIAMRDERGLWGACPVGHIHRCDPAYRVCASRLRHRIWTARTLVTATSRCSRPIRRTSTATTTASGARREERQRPYRGIT